MRSFVCVVLLLASGCLITEHGRGGGDDDCLAPAGATDTGGGGAASLPAPQRNPNTLTCESFGGGCDPSCGPCEGVFAPEVTWGFCGSSCESLDETACAADDTCRVVKDARCAIDGTCLTDFVGCFPTDQFVNPNIECTGADAQSCSENPACTAYHRTDTCGSLPPDQCSRDFALCMPEGASPGRCFEPALCDIPTPVCPTGTTPGVADGCYTGACIPDDLCEMQPPQPQPGG